MQQYNLTFPQRYNFLEEDYVWSDCNAYLADFILNFPAQWGVDPYPKALLLIGAKGSGKTHIANIWAKKAGAKFVGQDAILDFHHNYNIIVDDIENYDAKDLFHIFNHAHESGKYLLMTSSSKPDFILPDLQSRLNSIRNLDINMPDENMIKILLIKGFSDRSIKIGVEVVEYLSSRITRDFNSIAICIDELDQYALSSKRKITIPLIKELMGI